MQRSRYLHSISYFTNSSSFFALYKNSDFGTFIAFTALAVSPQHLLFHQLLVVFLHYITPRIPGLLSHIRRSLPPLRHLFIMSCPICCENFTAAKRKAVQCPLCPGAACVECCQKYILDSGTVDAACMSCKTPWNREFLALNFSKAFISRDYKSHREQVLFEREYALLPASQHMVEHWRRAQTLREEIPGMKTRIAELKRELEDLTNRHNRSNNELRIIMTHEYRRGAVAGTGADTAERRQFIKACPAENCRGFLSTAWKCGTCDVRVCPDCHVIKVAGEDHACNPDDVATATLLRRDTKSCPSCATMITKIDGCFARDTVIPMYDGTFKMSQDISVGDLLIGDDGNPRKVIDTCRGTDDLYEISQKNGISYIVNSKHKLVLKFSGECVPHWSTEQNAWKAWRFDQSSLKRKFIISETRENIKEIPGIYEITVDDFLKMSPSLQKDAMGFKSLGADWYSKPVIVDPYMMGLWLGDGIHTGDCIAAADPEIINYIYEWCNANGCELVHDQPYKFRIRLAGNKISKNSIGGGSSCESCEACKIKKQDICDSPLFSVEKGETLKSLLKNYNLIKNKHVPIDYIINDRDTRLNILAGFIDSDGHVSNNGKRIVIMQKKREISDSIIFIAHSLGFSVHVTMIKKKNIRFPNSDITKDYDDQYCINISGNIQDIPTLVSRKKCMPSRENKDNLRTGIFVEKIEKGEYFGWSLDGNKRFVLSDFTVVRNCDQMWCTQCHTAFSWRTGAIETSTVHNPHFYEWQRRQNGGVAPRVPGDMPGGNNACAGGGLLPLYMIEINPIFKENPHDLKNALRRAHRLVSHTHNVTVPMYRNARVDNADLRLYYLVEGITEKEWKQKLQQREKKAMRNDEARQIFEAFVEVGNIFFGDLLGQRATAAEVAKRFEDLVAYSNEALEKAEKLFGMKIAKISISN